MSNYESIPVDTRIIIEDHLRLNDNLKNAVGRLWGLYLRVNHGESDPAEQELQNFLNSLQYIGQQETMLNAINQEINNLERENNGNVFNGRGGIKKRKTGKKRKRTTKKTSKKRRKTLKGGKEQTSLDLNKQFNLYDENTKKLEMMRVQQEIQRQEAEQDGIRREQARIRREQAWWDQF
jgi:hypothetical protein